MSRRPLQNGIYFENDKTNLINPITFEKDKKDCYYPLRYKDCDPYRYEINPYGDIRNKYKQRLINPYVCEGRYKNVSIMQKELGIRKSESVHRLVASTFCPNINPDENIYVNHIDGDKHNNYFKNLEWCTPSDNVRHAYRTNLYELDDCNDYIVFDTVYDPDRIIFRGELNGCTRLKEEQVHHICRCMEKRMIYSDILEECGLELNKKNLDILTKIRVKKLWKHVSDQYDIPKKEKRTSPIIYTDEQLHTICKMIESNCVSKDIAEYLGINLKVKKESDKFYKFIQRVRNRETYNHISKYYKW